MRKDDNQTSEPKLGYPGGLATKFAADVRANALRAVVREIQAAGFARLKDITDELNRRNVPAARGANGWYRSGVARLLRRTMPRAAVPTIPSTLPTLTVVPDGP